jgi:transcriptional coactivator HFI1/ADA1
MSTAVEAYFKNMLARIMAVCRSNGMQYVQTRGYKRRRRREEEAFERGEIRKNAAGLLPVEQEAEDRRPPLSLQDLQMCVDVGTHGLGVAGARAMVRCAALGIDDELMFGERGEEDEDDHDVPPAKPLTNGVVTNGVHHNHHEDEDEEMVDVDDDYGWAGGSARDRGELDGILSGCLEI